MGAYPGLLITGSHAPRSSASATLIIGIPVVYNPISKSREIQKISRIQEKPVESQRYKWDHCYNYPQVRLQHRPSNNAVRDYT